MLIELINHYGNYSNEWYFSGKTCFNYTLLWFTNTLLIAIGRISILHIGMFKYRVVPLEGVIRFEYTFICIQ